MDSSSVAREVLGDMWEYGRIVLISLMGATYASMVSSRRATKGDRSQFIFGQVRSVLVIIGTFALFAFWNLQFGNIVTLIYAETAWGAFTVFVTVAMVLCLAIYGLKLLAAKRAETVLSIVDVSQSQALNTRTGKLVSRCYWCCYQFQCFGCGE